MKKEWLGGIFGAVVGDAVGVPYEFKARGTFECIGMTEYGTHHMPKGTWSDDSSMILATMDSIADNKKVVPEDIMKKFERWLDYTDYTASGKVFDCGVTVQEAIRSGVAPKDEMSNGNGSLMRILPVCLYCVDHGYLPLNSRQVIHKVAGLTHGHIRSKIGCGLYYCCVLALIKSSGTLIERLQWAMDLGFDIYKAKDDLKYYDRLKDLSAFMNTNVNEIKSSGYVVDTLEAAIWALLNSDSYEDCIKKAVNLGSDTDTVACVAGGLAGIYYGYDGIPSEWISDLVNKEMILSILDKM